MKKILSPVGALFVAGVLTAQTSPTSTENYIYSKTYLSDPSLPGAAKTSETVQYFDGLGRPNQVINIKASPSGKDIVTAIPYDQFGRQTDSWLPAPMPTQNGGLQQSVTNAAQSSYGDNIAFSHRTLESSPLNRVLSQTQPGTAWLGHNIEYEYGVNDAEDVKKYIATFNYANAQSSLSLAGMYEVSKLYKNTITDEDGNQTLEFKNGEGQVVLVRKMLSATQKADTYYIYNEYNQLAFVIPPLASKIQTLSLSDINNLCYQYKYDGRNRLTEKKLPGKGWEYMVYDKQDRLVMTQDSNIGVAKQWFFTKYDQFGRIAYTGIYTSTQNYGSAGRAWEQANVDSKESNNVTRTTAVGFASEGMDVYYDNTASSSYPGTITKLMSINYYDTYPAYSFNPAFPSNILGEITMTDAPTAEGLNTKSLPVMSLVKNIENDNWTKNYTYYDKKGRTIGSYSINHLGGRTKVESKLDFAGVVQQSITHHKRLNTDTDKVITENFTYDHHNRLTIHTHQVGSATAEYLAQNTYNELSQLQTKKVGGTILGSGLQTVDYTYNIRGWMTQINDPDNLGGDLFGYKINYNQIEGLAIPNSDFPDQIVKARYNGNIAEVSWKTATEQNEPLKRYGYSYDALNRLTAGFYQKAGNESAKEYFEKPEYDLNGNMTRLKRSEGLVAGSTTALMIDNLSYEYSGNRLIKIRDEQIGNSKGYPSLSAHNTITYDSNGNMITHLDKGIDGITYNYLNLPNNIKVNSGLKGAKTTQYTYRADGVKVAKTFLQNSVMNTILYLDGFQYNYSAASVAGSELKFVPTSEGYYDFINNSYIYNYTDHLGNVRLSFTDTNKDGTIQPRQYYVQECDGPMDPFNPPNCIDYWKPGEIVEINNYFPFGLLHNYTVTTANAYQYKYNGKELQETGMYAMDFRHYMPDIGRFIAQDGLSEIMPSWTPYRFAFNNPTYFSDPTGLFEEENNMLAYPDRPGTEKGQVWTDADGTFTWDGGMWRDSNGAGISYKETQIEGVTVSGGSKSSSNNVSWLWSSGYNIAKDSHIRLNYYYPNNRLIYNNYTSPAEYALYRYHLQQSTRAQLSTQGQAMSQILKTKEAQLATAKYYASKGIKPSGRIRGGAGTAQILRGAGTAVVVVSAGMSIYNVATADNKAQALSGEIGGWTGAWAGAEYGAMIGSFAGPWGTVIGGVVGGAVGYYYGSETGTELYNTLSE